MKYFKNAELARLYNVSEKSVRNWITAAEQGKVDLELYSENGRTFVADSVHNEARLFTFTERARKYRNKQSLRRLQPSEAFYKAHTPDQIIQIASELETYHEIPQQFRYLGAAGVSWSTYLHKLYGAQTINALTGTIKLLEFNKAYLLDIVANYDRVNVVDLGVGNGLAVKALLQTLQGTGKFNKYIGLDISPELLDITRHNIEVWFEHQIPFEGHIVDLNNQKFGSIIAKATFDDDTASTINIVTFLGSLLPNFRDREQALSLVRDSLNTDDILLTSLKLDSPAARSFFDFSTPAEKGSGLPIHHRPVLEYLDIDPSLYEVEQLYEPEAHCRMVRVRLKVDIQIAFETEGFNRIVTLEKGDRIVLWRAWHHDAKDLVNLFERAGFELLQLSSTPEERIALLTHRVKPIKP
jgi:uncharacterized SAM-dependent methyltransferase